MNRFAQNWDKILGFFMSVVLAGVVGFFSAMFVMQDRIGKLENRLAVLENTAVPFIDESKTEIGAIAGSIRDLNMKFSALNAQSRILISQGEIMLQLRVKE